MISGIDIALWDLKAQSLGVPIYELLGGAVRETIPLHFQYARSPEHRSIAFPAPRSHGMFWDPTDGTLHIAETNGGHTFRFETPSGELLSEWCIEHPEVHGFTRSADGSIGIGDASTNQVLVIGAVTGEGGTL